VGAWTWELRAARTSAAGLEMACSTPLESVAPAKKRPTGSALEASTTSAPESPASEKLAPATTNWLVKILASVGWVSAQSEK